MAAVPAVTPQHESGGQRHHAQRHPGQHQQDDELDLRQAGGTALAHRHLQQPVALTTAVTATGGAAPLVLPPSGQARSEPAPSSLPAQRVPAGLVVVVAPQCGLAGGSGVAGPADAVEASGAVEAAAGVEAGPADTVVQVDGAEASGKAGGAEAREAVDAVQAGRAIGTRPHQTVVHVGLTAQPREAGQAATRQLRREAVSILTKTAIFTRRPADKTGNGQRRRNMRKYLLIPFNLSSSVSCKLWQQLDVMLETSSMRRRR